MFYISKKERKFAFLSNHQGNFSTQQHQIIEQDIFSGKELIKNY
jgi:hypothetical protein